MILTNTKYLIAIVAAFAMLFAGVAVADTEDVAASEVAPAPVNYSVVYDVGGMLYTIDNKTSNVVTLKTLDELGATPSKGTTFLNWDLAGADYAAGSTYIITAEPSPGSSAVTVKFTADIKATEYTATFVDSDGKTALGEPVKGSIVTVSDNVATDKDPVALAPATPVKEGYIFIGWAVKGTDDVIKTADLPALTENVVYVATYAVDYVVTFIDGDKTYITNVSDLAVPDKGDRTGFTFLGWFVGSEQVTFVKGIDGKFTTDYEFVNDTTFTAKWEPVNVYVTFKAGDLVSEPVPVLYGTKVIMPALPEGYSAWDFDFDTPITGDLVIEAIAAPEPEPTGMDDPVMMTVIIIGAIILGALICAMGVMVKRGKIVIGRGPNAKKNNGNEGDIKP